MVDAPVYCVLRIAFFVFRLAFFVFAMTRILIVDDQPVFRRQLRRLLAYAGLIVVGEAGDIPEAEAQTQALQPDLAVVDVMLPGVNGLEGTPRLKALAPALRVILVSAYADRGDLFRAAAQAAGAEAFIAKDDLDVGVVSAWRRQSDVRDVIPTHAERSLLADRV
jgi:two-component system response regulator DesR